MSLWLSIRRIGQMVFRRNPMGRLQQSIEDPGAALAALLATYGVTTTRERNWIIFSESGHRAKVELAPDSNALKGALIHLHFSFEFSRGDRLVESVPGFGDNYIQAVPDAWRNFSAGSLPSILAAFLGYATHLVRQEEWTVANRRWLVTFGDLTMHPEHISPKKLPRDLLERLRKAIERLPLGSGIHWVQFFYSRSRRKRREFHDALLDNEPCLQLESDLAAIEFPDLGKNYSVGQFFVLLPIGPARS